MHHLIILLLLNAFILYPTQAKANSLSFDLIHHDSKSSPFYNHSMTESERSKEARIRSLNRLNHMNSFMLTDAKYLESDLTIGDYYINTYISDPKKRRLAIPSMSIALTWMRCSPCSNCGITIDDSPYDSRSSETYANILFDSTKCKELGGGKRKYSDLCQYEYHYGDNGVFSGVVGTETFYLRTPSNSLESFPDIVFGCEEEHQVHFKKSVQGIVGLGQGPFSLVSQVGETIGKKFSYCLVKKSSSAPSKIKFGRDLRLYTQHIEYKAKFEHSLPHASYYLNLEAISVNGEKITTPNKKHDMIVDIQTDLTSLPSDIYDEFILIFKKQFGEVKSVEFDKYGTCFSNREISGLSIPNVVFHYSSPFLSKGQFPVQSSTLLQRVGDTHMCLTIVPTEGVSALGNRAQVDVQMIFDLPSRLLTFAPLDCHTFAG